jgi:hypothetical protein
LTDNHGRPIAADVIVALQRDLLAQFHGFTIHPTSQGRWQSHEGRVYQEEVVIYEVAVAEEQIPLLRDIVVRLGWQLGQRAMYFDAPPPSVSIIDLSEAQPAGGGRNEPRQGKTTRRRGKKNRPAG